MSAFECRIDAGVATFVIDNPPQNRLSFAVIRGFAEAVQKVHGHPDVRVVVVRAAGENFCFGGDISNWLDLEPAQMGENTGRALSIFNAFEQLPVPVITAVQGPVHGGRLRVGEKAAPTISSLQRAWLWTLRANSGRRDPAGRYPARR